MLKRFLTGLALSATAIAFVVFLAVEIGAMLPSVGALLAGRV